MNCCRSINGVCPQCGLPCAPNVRRYCTRGPKADKATTPKPRRTKATHSPARQLPCDWLGQPTGEVALVKCQTCRGNVRKKQTLYDCAIFGRCLPHGRGETTAQQCVGCDRHTGRKKRSHRIAQD